MIFFRFWLLCFSVDGARFGTPVGKVAPEKDDDDAASRALEAAIIGLPKDIVSNAAQQHQLVEAEDAVLARPLKLRQQPKKLPTRQANKPQPMSQDQGGSKKQYPGYPGYYAPPQNYPPSAAAPVATVAPPMVPAVPEATVAPPVATTMAPAPAVSTTVAPVAPMAPVVTAAPPFAVTDLNTWKMQMESKLHRGLSSEITILNTLMKHQTQTHKQLLRFRQVMTVMGTKYQAQETLTQQQAAKIQSLEAQIAGLHQQVSTLNAKFSAYKEQYEKKWQGSQGAIDHLYKKTADALGEMNAIHDGVQKELGTMKLVSGKYPAAPNVTAPLPAQKAGQAPPLAPSPPLGPPPS